MATLTNDDLLEQSETTGIPKYDPVQGHRLRQGHQNG
jgi:hypothetical protein